MKQQKINQIFASVAKPVNPDREDDNDDDDDDDDDDNGDRDDAHAPAAEPGLSIDHEDTMSRADVCHYRHSSLQLTVADDGH